MPRYFQFKVQLQEAIPPVWRRFQLGADLTFADLHGAIQGACGWEECHPHCFFRRKPWRDSIAGTPTEDDPDSADVPLRSFFGKGKAARCVYVYDFGDEWRHDVLLEEELDLPEEFTRRLLGGERAFPPEDCGGVWGYMEFVRLLRSKKPRTDDEMERLEWLGEWDPERFDLERVRKSFDRPRRPGAEGRARRAVPKRRG